MQNSFPMREWHVKNMEKTIIKHVKGLSPDATKFERMMNNLYFLIHKVKMIIKYDIKHGVNNEEVILFLQKIRTGMEFTDLLKSDGSLDRLNEIESYFI